MTFFFPTVICSVGAASFLYDSLKFDPPVLGPLCCAAASERGSGPALIERALQRRVTRQLGNYGEHKGGPEANSKGTACLRCLSWPRRLIHIFSGAHQRRRFFFFNPLLCRLEQHQGTEQKADYSLARSKFPLII